MIYQIYIEAKVDSSLSVEKFQELLQICLHNSETGETTVDNKNNETFAVVDYQECEVTPICEDCGETNSTDRNGGFECTNFACPKGNPYEKSN
jgi:tRNA(Ile2) C34 agmatinyltransferase TiaS